MILEAFRSAGARRGALALKATLVLGALVQLSACTSEEAGQSATSNGAAGGGRGGGTLAQSEKSSEQVFNIALLHFDGKTNVNGAGDHGPEPVPATVAPSNAGFIVKQPDAKGEWSVRAFGFSPAQVVVRQGDTVALNFMGVQGASHTIAVDGQPERLFLKRGEIKTVRFVAERPGTYRFTSVGHQPTMQGSVLVLPQSGS